MSTEVTIGHTTYYKEDGVWYNEYGEEATRFEIIKIKVMTVFMLLIIVGFVALIITVALEQNKDTLHNTENSIFFHYGSPEDIAVRKCESYTFYEYVDPNIVMSCKSRTLNMPELRVISEPEMFEVTLTTASYYLEEGLLIDGNPSCTNHEFLGEGGKVTYEPSNTCYR